MMGHVLEALLSQWETQSEFLIPGFGLVQPWTVGDISQVNQWMGDHSLSPLFLSCSSV